MSAAPKEKFELVLVDINQFDWKVSPSAGAIRDLCESIVAITRVCGIAVRDLDGGTYAQHPEDLPSIYQALRFTAELGDQLYGHLMSAAAHEKAEVRA